MTDASFLFTPDVALWRTVLDPFLRKDPIIVLGMHRSGSTLVAEMLKVCGVHLGCNLEEHAEAPFFIDLNDWLLSLAHARWDNPLPFRCLLQDNGLLGVTAQELRRRVSGHEFVSQFLGRRTLIEFAIAPRFAWGWKDPRNTITVPAWRLVYPKAKVIFVYRHGVDVALSLAVREHDHRLNADLSEKDIARFASDRCLEPTEAFRLWEEYHELFFETVDANEHPSLLAIHFEEMVLAPRQTLARIAGYLALTVDEQAFDEATALVDKSRPFSFASENLSPQMKEAFTNSAVARRLGYTVNAVRKCGVAQTVVAK